jgi:hypothetical protein
MRLTSDVYQGDNHPDTGGRGAACYTFDTEDSH